MRHSRLLRSADPSAADNLDVLSTRMQLAAAAILVEVGSSEATNVTHRGLSRDGGLTHSQMVASMRKLQLNQSQPSPATPMRRSLELLRSPTRRISGRGNVSASRESLSEKSGDLTESRHAALLDILSMDDGVDALELAVSVQAKVRPRAS